MIELLLSRRARRAVLAAAALLPLAAVPGRAADVQGIQSRWAQMDRCTRQAQQLYPENDAASQEKRRAFSEQCQRRAGLPIRSAPGTPRPEPPPQE